MLWPTRRVESYPSPWDSGDLHDSTDELLNEFFGVSTKHLPNVGVAPRFDISETDSSVIIEAELPGLDEKDIELTIKDSVLTLKGEKKRDEKVGKKNYYIVERSYGQFQRALQLGTNVNTSEVNATFKQGVLTITVPKLEPEKSKARTIDIKAA